MNLPEHPFLPARADETFDRLATLVTERLEVPMSLVSLVSVDGQVLPGAAGLAEPWRTERATPLSHSFCQHVVSSGAPLIVENANDDPLVAHNAAVMELGVIAYAGMPLHAGTGSVVGSMCAIDHRPREWTDDQLSELAGFADVCSAELVRRGA